MPFAVDNSPTPRTAVDAGRRFATTFVIHPPLALNCDEHQDSVITADLCGVRYHWKQRRWARERCVVSSRTQYACSWIILVLLLCAEYLDLEQSTNNRSSSSSKSSGCSYEYPRTSLSTLLAILAYCTRTPARGFTLVRNRPAPQYQP
jgi:hypothetical protein